MIADTSQEEIPLEDNIKEEEELEKEDTDKEDSQ